VTKLEKYLNRQNAPIPQEHLDILKSNNDIPEAKVLARAEVNKLLMLEYIDSENGYRRNNDGSTYVAVLTKMPKVTLEMIDWWFWWHAAESVRYQIWYPEMHYDIEADFGTSYNDDSKSYRERLQLSTHYVTEDIGLGKENIVIDFKSPSEFGFDTDLIDAKKQSIICARVGSQKTGIWGVEMCHFVRVTNEGVEMRSRFWMGYKVQRMNKFGARILNTILNQSFIKRTLIPKNIGHNMFHHCSQEYHNLAKLLPDLYPTENLIS